MCVIQSALLAQYIPYIVIPGFWPIISLLQQQQQHPLEQNVSLKKTGLPSAEQVHMASADTDMQPAPRTWNVKLAEPSLVQTPQPMSKAQP